jgi:MFS family permease
MNPDGGNAAQVVSVRSRDGRSEVDMEIDLEKSKDIDIESFYAPSRTALELDPAEAIRPVSEIYPYTQIGPIYSRTRLISLVLTVTGAAFLNTLGIQVVVIVLPTIGRDLHIPDSRLQWIVSAYSLTFGCFLLLWGRLADVYGKRPIFILGSLLITLVSIAIPFSPGEITFDLLRGLQGLGAAANVPTALGILGTTFPPGKAKNYAFSCYGAGAPLGAVFGNILGGLVGQYVTWHWVFWILALLASLVSIAAVFIIPRPPQHLQLTRTRPSVDWIGGALVTSGLLVLLFALTEGNVVNWSTPWVPSLIVVSLLLIAAFVVWQWYLEHKTSRPPLMKVSVFRNTRFSAAMLIMMLFFASFSNYMVYATYFYQDYQGLSVIQTTLRFIPTGIVGLCTAFTTAHLLSRVRGNHLLMFGTICVAISSLLFAIPLSPNTTYWAYGFPAMILAVFGADTLYPTLTLFTAQRLPMEEQALGGALINAVGQVGRALGLALATAIETAVISRESGLGVDVVGAMTQEKPRDPALLKGLRAANWADFAFAMVGFAIVIIAFRGAGKIGSSRK